MITSDKFMLGNVMLVLFLPSNKKATFGEFCGRSGKTILQVRGFACKMPINTQKMVAMIEG
jgi:hypothetical protein